LPSSAKKHPIWHFCCSRELIFAELGKKAPFSEKGAVITGALRRARKRHPEVFLLLIRFGLFRLEGGLWDV
jgi:hypothetical protein